MSRNEADSGAGRRAVVVGGSGFIGSRLALSLASSGFGVTVVDVTEPFSAVSDACDVELRDVTVAGSFQGALEQADVVFMLAAKLAKGCTEDPAAGWAVNVEGTANVLSDVLASGRRPRIIFMSSGAVYATPAERVPIPETAATRGRGLYEASKLRGESLVASAARTGRFSAVVLRPFTVYGPGPASGARGHFIAAWLEHAACGLPLPVHGNGNQTVDLTHVDDLVRACVLAMAFPLAPGASRTFNVGSGVETAVREVARWIGEFVPSLEIRRVAAPGSVPSRQLADLERARAELGYSPRVLPDAGVKGLLTEWALHCSSR